MSYTGKAVYEKIRNQCPSFSIENYKNIDTEIAYSHYHIECIIETILLFMTNNYDDIAKELFLNIIDHPHKQNGKFYETLIYHWLISRKIPFIPQPKVDKENCLKNSSYNADGRIDNVYFDIKAFGITSPHFETLRIKLSEKLPGYIITIGGDLNISVQDLKKYALEKINDIVSNLQQHRNHNSFIYKIPGICLEVRAIPTSEGMASSISSFNAYEWAKNNQFYFMHHGSQFCTNAPYIIFCAVDGCNAPMFHSEDAAVVDIMLRPLCRRIFMNLIKMTDKKLSSFDGKARGDISISEASEKISAIVFSDITTPQDYSNCRTWVYVNPHADNPLHAYQIDSWFRFNGAFIDDFKYDVY